MGDSGEVYTGVEFVIGGFCYMEIRGEYHRDSRRLFNVFFSVD